MFYYDLWGRREAKYAFLREQSLASIEWTPLTPHPPLYLFVPQDTSLQEAYEQGWRIPAIFPTHSVGIVTARDNLFPVLGDHTVVRVRFDGERVWINETQYFAPVSEAVWAVRIGGYPVCEKWLSDRKGHRLTLEEILTYQRVVSALTKTIALQAQIDAVCRQAWRW